MLNLILNAIKLFVLLSVLALLLYLIADILIYGDDC